MAHHGSDLKQFNKQFDPETFRKEIEDSISRPKFPMDEFVKSIPAEQANKINKALEAEKGQFGATGNFPDGKLTTDDEGEIQIGITQVDGRVVMNFGKAITWIGFTKEQALQIADSLIKHAE